jgi:hypothetical protein
MAMPCHSGYRGKIRAVNRPITTTSASQPTRYPRGRPGPDADAAPATGQQRKASGREQQENSDGQKALAGTEDPAGQHDAEGFQGDRHPGGAEG